ncbi:hypothetical protein [Ignatzschineria sp. LJL83]
MEMNSTSTTQEIVQVIFPEKNNYLLRLQSLEIALQKQPHSPIIPFLMAIVSAQNTIFQSLNCQNTPISFSQKSSIINTANLSENFKQATILLCESLIEIFEKSDDSQKYSEIIKILLNLLEKIEDAHQNNKYFQKILNLDLELIPAPKRIFLLTSMQALLHSFATNCSVGEKHMVDNKESCPCCKMPAISSVLDNSEHGLRYLYCSFCETKWHVVRSTCTICDSNQFLYRDKIEQLNSPMHAEVCDECYSYLKFLDRSQTPNSDPFIEDLITLPLSIKLSNAHYKTFGLNPYLV